MNFRWRIAGYYFFYYAYVGAYVPFWTLYLRSLRFDAVDIAVLAAIQPVMRMVAPALWGWLADGGWEFLMQRLSGKPGADGGSRRQVVQAAALLSALSFIGVFFTTGFWGLFVMMSLWSFFWSASIPLVDASTMAFLGKDTARYGRIRAWGSVGFIVAVLGLGYLFDYVAIHWLLWAGMGILLGILFFSTQLPVTRAEPHHADDQPLMRMLLRPAVLALLGAGFLMAVAHGPYYTFFSIYLVEHGYAKSAVGLLWALGVVCEIGAFFLMPWLTRRMTLTHIIGMGLAAAVVRFLLIAWGVDTLGIVVIAQSLHALTFGAFHAAAIAMIHQFFPGRHQSRGQALYGSLTYGAGGMAGGLLSGPLWEHWGASAMYSFSAAAAMAGLGLLLWKVHAEPAPAKA